MVVKISSSLHNEMKKLAPTLTTAWLVERTDGYKLGFTSWDKDFVYDLDGSGAMTYSPTNSFSASAAVGKTDLSVDNMNTVALTSDLITRRDLLGGLWDNAKVRVFWINPDHPEYGHFPIRGGRMGEITVKNQSFETELRSPAQKLQQPYGRLYTLDCGVEYGSDLCGMKKRPEWWQANKRWDRTLLLVRPRVYNGYWYTGAPGGVGAYSGAVEPVWPTGVGATVGDDEITWTAMGADSVTGTVTGVFNRGQFVDSGRGEVGAFWQYGLLTWLSGENAGYSGEIRAHRSGGGFNLLEAMPFNIDVGDTYELIDGCALTLQACKDHNNILNFRGFPHMPTEERALTTPNISKQAQPQDDDDGGSF